MREAPGRDQRHLRFRRCETKRDPGCCDEAEVSNFVDYEIDEGAQNGRLPCSGIVLPSHRRKFDRFFICLGEVSLQLIVSSCGRKKKAGSIFRDLETSSPKEVLLFRYEVNFVNQLRTKKAMIVSVHCKNKISITFLVQIVMETWTAVRERGGRGSWEGFVQPYLYYVWS